ncbi:hypothetical protein D9M68_17990 [compost metagenome]
MVKTSRSDTSHHQAARPSTRPTNEREPFPYQQKNATRLRGASHQHEEGIRGAPVTTVAYYNYTDRDVIVTSRDGTAITVQPVGRRNCDEFIVCVTHQMTRSSMERAVEILRNRAAPDEPESHFWIRAYDGALYADAHNPVLQASVEYVIYYNDLMNASGRCYMPEVDLLVEWSSDRGAVHPFDKTKRDEAMVSSIAPGVGDSTFVFMIKAVDNAAVIQRSTRYVNIGGEVFVIPIERDLDYLTGIHVVSRAPVKDGCAVSDVITRHYTFEEADVQFSLHRTVEDAINGGPLETVAKTIIERETTARKVGEAMLRTEQLDADAELQRLRNEGALSKAQQDKESAARRNYVEWAKTGVALLGAAITIYGILSKLKS